ncbi:NADH dehydrogenase [ubiquinone] 1 beta subcomplex subunit 8, mitochondrial [Malaya genurostris]|uniref:NADH dehydrogenase [ubiquinone] 1 beta subcomplex subunit 8, mitochondrial n=1 Tax=Malaya genurostris TaxID=325434 RepID=UPI0026F3B02B|nr:NADH dehydrogenase [ubiquinone] 1 beta subcomplex subunit 8, mitochondrial [Malaya genurostris]
MAALIKGLKLVSQIAPKHSTLFALSTRQAHGWNKDFKPGKIPETEKEREAAARKYGLHPSEYQTYPDDGAGFGDYPKLPDTPVETRDPYYPYDFPELKRNLHDPIHVHASIYGEDRYGTAEPLRFPIANQWYTFIGVMTACFVVYFWLENYKMFRPVLEKQYPHDGPHYTFEKK